LWWVAWTNHVPDIDPVLFVRVNRNTNNKFDGLVKSRNMHNFVIPVKTGIQSFQALSPLWTPVFTGMTDFLRMH